MDVNSFTVSYLIYYDSLLQNAIDIISKCDSYFITKCGRSLLENAPGFLLQSATVLLQKGAVIADCDFYWVILVGGGGGWALGYHFMGFRHFPDMC